MTQADNVLKEIKQRGYWRVNLRPATFQPKLVSDPAQCKQILRQAAVRLRGWDYPHVPTRDDNKQAFYVAGDKAEAWISWEMYQEVWRYYQSGQFIHFFGIHDDWYVESKELPINEPWRAIVPGSQIDIIEIIYSLTEIYVLLKNLIGAGVYTSDMLVDVSLHIVNDRHLAMMDPRRLPLMGNYICHVDKINLPTQTVTLLGNPERFEIQALDAADEVFQQFQWDAPKRAFQNDQKKLLERRWYD